jgi:hypothetical protein
MTLSSGTQSSTHVMVANHIHMDLRIIDIRVFLPAKSSRFQVSVKAAAFVRTTPVEFVVLSGRFQGSVKAAAFVLFHGS